jgi:hypothetical protein
VSVELALLVRAFAGRGMVSQLSSEGGTMLAGICSVLWSGMSLVTHMKCTLVHCAIGFSRNESVE